MRFIYILIQKHFCTFGLIAVINGIWINYSAAAAAAAVAQQHINK